MSSLIFNHDHIILDACCVINLYASSYIESILSSIPIHVIVADYVKNEEVLNILAGPEEDVDSKKEPVDLQPLIDRGLIKVVSPDNETESEAFVYFASEIDDGEAITGAIAYHRNWAIGTDDKKATDLFWREAPQNQIISTPELLKYWTDSNNPSTEEISKALQNIHIRARYFPDENHPLYDWWVRLANPEVAK